MRWSGITRGVRQHPLVAFYVLACVLAWWPWPLYAAGIAPSPIVGFGPFLAAMVVLAITEGRAGVGALLRRMVQWRVAPRWYAVALLLPIVLSSASAGLNLLLGAAAPSPARLGTWPGLFGTFAVLLLVPGIAGTWEEPGWRGYALPRLQARRSALAASLILGVLWVPWHLPLFLSGTIPVSDAAMIVAQAVVFTWVFNSSGGSVLLLMFLHAMNNTMSWWNALFSGADATRQGVLLAGLWCLVAAVVVMVAGPARLSRHEAIGRLRLESQPASGAAVGSPGPAHASIPAG